MYQLRPYQKQASEAGCDLATTKKEKDQVKTGDIIIPFGKYKDNKLKEINDDYLKWAINKFDTGKWKTIFNNELTRRAGNAN